MKVKYTTSDGRLTFEFDAGSDKEIFRQLAHLQEIYEDTATAYVGEMDSGRKKVPTTSTDYAYRTRRGKYKDEKGKEKEAEYFEKVVRSGPLKWFKKAYGVLDDSTDNLFPKRMPNTDKNYSKYIHGENGWMKWNSRDSEPDQNSE